MRVVSGIQPTGKPHLGNYLGPSCNYVKLQDEAQAAGERMPDFPRRPARHFDAAQSGGAARGTRKWSRPLVACGIDPHRSILFNQAGPAHAELQWLLNGTARWAGSTA